MSKTYPSYLTRENCAWIDTKRTDLNVTLRKLLSPDVSVTREEIIGVFSERERVGRECGSDCVQSSVSCRGLEWWGEVVTRSTLQCITPENIDYSIKPSEIFDCRPDPAVWRESGI